MDLGEAVINNPAMTNPAMTKEALQALSPDALDALERKIAGKYMHRIPWGAVAWAFSNLMVWLSLWPLVLFDYLPIWAAFPIAVLNVALSYLPSHEANTALLPARATRYAGSTNW